MEKAVLEVTSNSWEEEVSKEDKVVIAMFYMVQCPHCAELKPYFEQFALEFSKDMKFVRIDVLNNMDIGSRYMVTAAPTFVVFCHGDSVRFQAGAPGPGELREMIVDVIKNGQLCLDNTTPMYG